MADKKSLKNMISTGSALILAVVLTTLLAVIGVLFVLVARVDKIATSAISENRELNWAADSVIAKISQELVLDVPGVVAGREYYDYPGPQDRWLASLEPNDNRMWPQISDLYYKLGLYSRNMPVGVIPVPDYQDAGSMSEGQIADADGDGVADSRWVVIPDVNSSKGRPIYAAIRIIDNGGMLNVNTAFKFNPADPCSANIDGHSQLQINLMALAGRPGDPPTVSEEANLRAARANFNPLDLRAYEENVIWRYGTPNGPYTPFDISDELELRYRFLLNHTAIDTRLEGWGGEFRKPSVLSTPVTSGGKELDTWFKRAYDTGVLDPNYAYRHIATTHNMDRIIDPCGGKMLNVNASYRNSSEKNAYMDLLYSAIYWGFSDAGFSGLGASQVAAQATANLIDFRDDDNDVTSYRNPGDGQIYYGFERPCIYISELAHNFVPPGSPTDSNHHSYAIELYKPYPEDSVPSGKWQLKFPKLGAATINWREPNQFHVAVWEDSLAPLTVNSAASSQKASLAGGVVLFNPGDLIELQREVVEPDNKTRKYITVDSIQVPASLVSGQGLPSFQRDIRNKHKCIRRLWGSSSVTTLGSVNLYVDDSKPEPIQARPANRLFTNIGEIGMIFREDVYGRAWQPTDTELAVRLNLADSAFQQIFNYLTVIDPADHGQPSSETRIKGRININTAPWFVIAQLPWMQPSIARAIVGYRDTAAKGLRSIGELMNVAEMGFYTYDNIDLNGFPDLTPNDGDGIQGNFEERDVIFARISNLVTVRSDVFTVYILVRIGSNGPQKRVIAILDRSGAYSRDGKVKIIALQPVPDPR